MKLVIEYEIEAVDSFEDEDVIARVYYPDEGSVIKVKKGLNTITLSKAIHHEIGHVIDFLISGGNQSKDTEIREYNADIIGEAIRWKESK